MNFSFLEWIDEKQVVNEYDASGFSESEFAYQSGIDYWVITNSGRFLKDILQYSNEGDAQIANEINPLNYSLFHVDGVEGSTVSMSRPEDKFANIRSKRRSYSGGAERTADLNNLIDVTEAFRKIGVGKANDNNRYFIDQSRSTMNRMRPEEFQKRLDTLMDLIGKGGEQQQNVHTSDELSMMRNLKRINDLINQGVLQNDPNALERPEVTSILTHPEALATAQRLGLQGVIQYMQNPSPEPEMQPQNNLPMECTTRLWRDEIVSTPYKETASKKLYFYYPS